MVEAESGEMRRVELDDGSFTWRVTHTECPPRVESVGGNTTGEVIPRWAVYGEGTTREGNRTHGVRIVDGEAPHFSAVPLNAPARQVAATWPPAQQSTSEEYRRAILARYGHTEESFARVGELRAEYRRVVPASERHARGEPTVGELEGVIAKWRGAE